MWEELPEQIETHTYDAAGVITGTRYVNRWKKIVKLTPKGQIAYDSAEDIKVVMNQVSLAKLDKLRTVFGNTIDTSQLPARPVTPVLPTLDADVSGLPAPALITSIGDRDLIAHLDRIHVALKTPLYYDIRVARSARIIELGDKGIFAGSVAYERAMREFDNKANDMELKTLLEARGEQTRMLQAESLVATFHNTAVSAEFEMATMVVTSKMKIKLQAYQAAVAATEFAVTIRRDALQEQMAIQNLDVNQLSSLMHGGQVPVPQFQAFQHGTIAQTPVAESVYRSAAIEQQNYQSKLSQHNQMMGGLMSLLGNAAAIPFMPSDARLKADIVYLLTDRHGVRWHEWRYLWDHPSVRRIGVMAQELLSVRPDAVVMTDSGFFAVDYGRLA
jgi:hypothetical protein